jgi:hypothetical protein
LPQISYQDFEIAASASWVCFCAKSY